MTFENSAEQYKSEVHQPSTATMLPSNHEYQQFFKPTFKNSSQQGFLDFGQTDIYGDQVPIKVAQDVPVPMLPTLVPSPEQLGFSKPGIDNAAKAVGVVTDLVTQKAALQAEKTWNPYRGDLTAEMSKIPESAWHQAYETFPQFKEAGLNEKQAIEVMQAIVRNELYNYDLADKSADDDVRKGETPLLTKVHYKGENQITLGLAQLSTKGVHDREAEYPNQVNFKGHEEQALMQPQNVPLLVAATLAHNIDMYQRHYIPVTEESLAYSYNPPDKRHVLPSTADLTGSGHVANVMHQLAIIRHQIEPKLDEN